MDIWFTDSIMMHFLIISCVFTLFWSPICTQHSNDETDAVVKEMMAEIKDLKTQMVELREQMNKMASLSHETALETRFTKVENELRAMKELKTKEAHSVDGIQVNQTVDKIYELETKVTYNTMHITDLSNRTENLLVNCTCANDTRGNVTWDACASGPCPAGATCLNLNGDGFVCLCQNGNISQTCDGSFSDATFLATSSSVLLVNGGDTIVFDEARINPGKKLNSILVVHIHKYIILP